MFPLDNKRKNLRGSQMPVVMDCKGTDKDNTWALGKVCVL